MPESALSPSHPFLLVGTSNSLLIADQLCTLSDDLIINLRRDTTSIEAICGLFSASHPARLRQGTTLILDCFANDVRLADRDGFTAEALNHAFQQLCQWLLNSDQVARLVLINLWPAALNTEPLHILADQIRSQRHQVLKSLEPTLECRMIDIGRDSQHLEAPDHPDHLNQAGLDRYQQCLRELLAEPGRSHPSHADTTVDAKPWLKRSPPRLCLEAGALATDLAPIGPLNTFSSSIGAEVYLPLSVGIEVHLPAHSAKANLLSISYLATASSTPISIRNSEQHGLLNSSTESIAAGQRTARFPLGAMVLKPGDPLIIEPCHHRPPGVEEIPINDHTLITPGQVSGESANQDNPCGLLQLHFDRDISAAYGRRAITKPAPSPPPGTLTGTPSIPAARKVTVRLFSVGMWPGYQAATHGCFRDLPGVDVLDAASIEEADAIIVGVFPSCGSLEQQYQTLKATTDLPLIFYTNEHSSEGVLPGIGQLDFTRYQACLSHYSVSHPQHVWSPMAVNWFGWDCDTQALHHQQASLSAQPLRHRISQAIFCYSNDSCEHRNQTAEHLEELNLLHSCGGHLNNQGGETAPRDLLDYLQYCSAFKGYMAFENSHFPGYLTEKVLMGIMAGCRTFYWGDSTVNTLFSEQHCLNLTGLSPRDCARVIAQDLHSNMKPAGTVQPFKPAFRERLLDGRSFLSRIIRALV